VLKIDNKMKIRKLAFSLIEIVVVVTIIAIMVAVAVANFQGMNTRSRDARKIEDLNAIQKAMELAYDKLGGNYPADVSALLTTGTLEVWPVTPQGVAYSLSSTGTSYCVCIWMETNKGGNSTQYDDGCNHLTNDPNAPYYCVKNQQ